MPKTLYHASRHAFSAVDDSKLGAGQNLYGRGFYTSQSPIDCIYFITEDGMMDFGSRGNPVDAAIYAFDLKDGARILENDQPISPALAADLKAAGEKIGNPDIARLMVDSKTINGNFHHMAASSDGMAILRAAGVDALATGSYICVINTEGIGNLRLYDTSGDMAVTQKQSVQNALDNAETTHQKFEALSAQQPKVASAYQRIRDAMVDVAGTIGKSEHVQHLQTVLKHFLVEEVETKPDPQKNILPLNRFLSETRKTFGLYDDAPMAPVTDLVNKAVAEIHTVPKAEVETKFTAAPVKHAEDSKFVAETVKPISQKYDGPYTVDNLFPEESTARGIAFPDGADEKLFKAAEDMVNVLNKMHQENGSVPGDLRNAIVQNTARLASPPSSPHYNHDWQKGNLSWMGNIRDQVNGAGYLHTQIKMLELSRPHSVSQEAGAALRRFVGAFAETKGASTYTALALEKAAPDDDAIVVKLNNAAPQATQVKPTAQKL